MHDWIWDDESFYAPQADPTPLASYRLFLFRDDDYLVMDAQIPSWLQRCLGASPNPRKNWLAWLGILQFTDNAFQKAIKQRATKE